jgi:hypothetical protein
MPTGRLSEAITDNPGRLLILLSVAPHIVRRRDAEHNDSRLPKVERHRSFRSFMAIDANCIEFIQG